MAPWMFTPLPKTTSITLWQVVPISSLLARDKTGKFPSQESTARTKSSASWRHRTGRYGLVLPAACYTNYMASLNAVPELSCTVQILRQTSDGTIWIGTVGNGLWAYRDGTLKRIGDTGVAANRHRAQHLRDTDHRIWIGTQNGLVRLEKTQIGLVPLLVQEPNTARLEGPEW